MQSSSQTHKIITFNDAARKWHRLSSAEERRLFFPLAHHFTYAL